MSNLLFFLTTVSLPVVFMLISLRNFDGTHEHLKLFFYVATAILFFHAGFVFVGTETVEWDEYRISDNSDGCPGGFCERLPYPQNMTVTVYDASEGHNFGYIGMFFFGMGLMFVVFAVSEVFMLLERALKR